MGFCLMEVEGFVSNVGERKRLLFILLLLHGLISKK